jgi:hypothetical protein
MRVGAGLTRTEFTFLFGAVPQVGHETLSAFLKLSSFMAENNARTPVCWNGQFRPLNAVSLAFAFPVGAFLHAPRDKSF